MAAHWVVPSVGPVSDVGLVFGVGAEPYKVVMKQWVIEAAVAAGVEPHALVFAFSAPERPAAAEGGWCHRFQPAR